MSDLKLLYQELEKQQRKFAKMKATTKNSDTVFQDITKSLDVQRKKFPEIKPKLYYHFIHKRKKVLKKVKKTAKYRSSQRRRSLVMLQDSYIDDKSDYKEPP